MNNAEKWDVFVWVQCLIYVLNLKLLCCMFYHGTMTVGQNVCHFAVHIKFILLYKSCSILTQFHWILSQLTHWGRVTHICICNITIIGPDNGLSPSRHQAIIWTNAGILLIGPWGTNFSEILIGIHTFSFKKIHLKMSSVKWRPFCLGLNMLKQASIASVTGLAPIRQ